MTSGHVVVGYIRPWAPVRPQNVTHSPRGNFLVRTVAENSQNRVTPSSQVTTWGEDRKERDGAGSCLLVYYFHLLKEDGLIVLSGLEC